MTERSCGLQCYKTALQSNNAIKVQGKISKQLYYICSCAPPAATKEFYM